MADQVTAKLKSLVRKIGDEDAEVSFAALKEFCEVMNEPFRDGVLQKASALRTPVREGVMPGDITAGIFEIINLDEDAAPEFPLDMLRPGTEKDFYAYTLPNHGYIPQRNVESDYVMVPTFEVGNAIDWLLRYARKARWDVVSRALQIYQAGFVKKINDDCWHTILSAVYDRNILVYDSDANAGQFTKRLVSLIKTLMRRNGGGNSTSMNRGKLTDLYVSPEAVEDMRDWNVDQVDEKTRYEIYNTPDGSLNRIYNVNLHDLDELGEGQEYQNYFSNTLSGSMASGDLELVVGLDLSTNDSFMMPVKSPITTYPDTLMHRERRAGVYGWTEYGVGALDGRRGIAGSL